MNAVGKNGVVEIKKKKRTCKCIRFHGIISRCSFVTIISTGDSSGTVLRKFQTETNAKKYDIDSFKTSRAGNSVSLPPPQAYPSKWRA